ncbi:MAG: nucleotide sugar dehydrogenase [Acidobacteria bacterium]|nr:nucleotide sugar dehydrogenase [Acidobacteriota bacterium]
MIKDELKNLIAEKRARIGVIGLGYVGLPLIIEFALKGFSTTGFEVDGKKVDSLNGGVSHIVDVPSTDVEKAIAAGKFGATTDFSQLKACDVIIICVPTPLRKTKDPDMSYILAAGEEIKKYARRGQLVILESTTYPGTTDEVLQPMIEEAGLKLDEDFLLAFSPERVDPGNPQFQTHNITKVVGGVGKDSTEVSTLLYSQIVEKVHPVSSARVAEAAKLWENTFRAINIGMANEMAKVCNALNIDTWEVVRAAATKPFGFMAFYPGPGIGGHCLSGKETVIVRDENGRRIENLQELFKSESSKNRVRRFDVHGSDVIYKPGLEALSVNMETNKPEWKPVQYLFKRDTDAELVKVTTSDNRKLTVTDLHPMLVVNADGKLVQVFAKDLKPNDRLPLQNRQIQTANCKRVLIDVIKLIPENLANKVRVVLSDTNLVQYREKLRKHLSSEKLWELSKVNYLSLADFRQAESELGIDRSDVTLRIGRGPSSSSFPAVVELTSDLCRLIGYYLAEGCATKEKGNERIRFSFHRLETEFIDDVRQILNRELGVKSSVHDSRIHQVTHIRVASALFGWFLVEVLQCGRRSTEMQIPDALLDLPETHKTELLKGLLRGDGDVYVSSGMNRYERNGRIYNHKNTSAEIGYFSSSEKLFQQVVFLLQEQGFTPTFKRVKPHLQMKGRDQIARMADWLGEKGSKLQTYFSNSLRSTKSKTFKVIGDLMTVPVKSVEIIKNIKPTEVFSIEVEGNHTFATSYGLFVHNCIPLDPHYLSWKARQHGFDSQFITLAEQINSGMPRYVAGLVRDALNDHQKSVKGSKILILGVAYKKDIDDMRESPALSVIDLLRSRGADVVYHDAFVPEVTFDHSYHIGVGDPLYNLDLTDELLESADCVVICTEHSEVDYTRVCRLSKVIVDTRNALSEDIRNGSSAKVIRL